MLSVKHGGQNLLEVGRAQEPSGMSFIFILFLKHKLLTLSTNEVTHVTIAECACACACDVLGCPMSAVNDFSLSSYSISSFF